MSLLLGTVGPERAVAGGGPALRAALCAGAERGAPEDDRGRARGRAARVALAAARSRPHSPEDEQRVLH